MSGRCALIFKQQFLVDFTQHP